MAQTPPASRRLSRALLLALPALLLAGGLLADGCSPVTRYRVLSFFFDDVPPPPGLPANLVRQTPGVSPATGRAATGGPRVAPPLITAPPPVYYHAPYRLRECSACHASSASFLPPTNQIKVCGKCHANFVDWRPDDKVHGPAALGRCTFCHVPHKGKYPRLLTTPEPDLCFECHDKARLLAQSYHRQGNVTDCTRCHDPHSAGNGLLLADSRTYARSNPPLLEEPKGHAAWSKDICATCHLATKSNALVKDVDKKCLLCHKIRDLAPPGKTLHPPVALGKCTTCHTPHRSPLPHLIKPDAEKICYQCHKPADLRTPSHPEVVRANCLICHHGHYSNRPHLLRTGIPAGG